jgi:hypothetical protein
LQHLIGIFKKVAVFIALRAEHLGRQLRGNLDSGYGRIFGDITNLVYLDAGFPGKRGFQLLRERGRLGISAGEGANETCQLRLRQRWSEVNAGDARGNQQLREAALSGGRSQGHAIQQNLGARSAEQYAAASAFIEGAAQLFPGGFKLRGGAHVPKLIEARELQENVETSYECPR